MRYRGTGRTCLAARVALELRVLGRPLGTRQHSVGTHRAAKSAAQVVLTGGIYGEQQSDLHFYETSEREYGSFGKWSQEEGDAAEPRPRTRLAAQREASVA